MSKLDKNIQDAKVWRKKHESEGETLRNLDKALATWEAKVALVEKAKEQLNTAKAAAVEARKAVSEVLKKTKADRKAKALSPAEPVAAKKVATKKVTPKKPSSKATTGPAQ